MNYIIKLKDSSSVLVVNLTKADSGEGWEGQFDEDFIENLTKKTGNMKTFKVFTKMLMSALEKTSDSVMVDVLTARDLELLKERKTKESSHGGSLHSQQGTTRLPGNQARLEDSKMFMILTYMVEFDKVHYPLSLSKVNSGTDKTHLLGVIDSLRKELASYKTQGTGQKSMTNPALDLSISRSHTGPPTFQNGQTLLAEQLLLSPHPEPKHYGSQPQGYQQFSAPGADSQLLEAANQRSRLLEAKISALQRQHADEIAKLAAEHGDEMRLVLKHAADLEQDVARLAEEAAQWKEVADQRRMSGGKEREEALKKDVEVLKRKVNEALANEKILRAQLKQARDTIDQERKKFGVVGRKNSREKVARPDSPWKKPASRSSKCSFN